jgi:hypothetical protein
MKKIERAEFNWDTAFGSAERVAWLKENHNKPVTEDEYVEHIKSLPHDHPKASRCRGPSRNRKDYQYLKARFGFFGGSDEA